MINVELDRKTSVSYCEVTRDITPFSINRNFSVNSQLGLKFLLLTVCVKGEF